MEHEGHHIWEPTRTEPQRGQTRPPHPRRPPPPPQVSHSIVQVLHQPKEPAPLVRFRPDRPRQPELLRQSEERNSRQQPTLKPASSALAYQLKPKKGQEKLAPALQAFIEPTYPEVPEPSGLAPAGLPPPKANQSNV